MHTAVSLDAEHRLDAYRTCPANTPEIIANHIDYHKVLGSVFRVGREEVGGTTVSLKFPCP
jgi:hypothetical protein